VPHQACKEKLPVVAFLLRDGTVRCAAAQSVSRFWNSVTASRFSH
jgi:hypothetical protein